MHVASVGGRFVHHCQQSCRKPTYACNVHVLWWNEFLYAYLSYSALSRYPVTLIHAMSIITTAAECVLHGICVDSKQKCIKATCIVNGTAQSRNCIWKGDYKHITLFPSFSSTPSSFLSFLFSPLSPFSPYIPFSQLPLLFVFAPLHSLLSTRQKGLHQQSRRWSYHQPSNPQVSTGWKNQSFRQLNTADN